MSDDVRADPLPCLNTRSIGHPQFTSTKSMPPASSLAMTSAVGTRFAGLFPATCTPNVFSEGCRRTSDHSSFDPAKNELASPTETVTCQTKGMHLQKREPHSRHRLCPPRGTHRADGMAIQVTCEFHDPVEVSQSHTRFPTVVKGARSIANSDRQ